jgi:cell wall-associated NlpC family hydrolase
MNAATVARQWIGTPYHHQGRLPGVGLDCIGLLICAARELGYVPPDFNITGYRRVPDGHSLMRHMSEQFTQIDRADMAPGDYVCIAFDRHPHHVGIIGAYPLGGLSIIHANSKVGRVEETRLVFNDYMRFVAAFRKDAA